MKNKYLLAFLLSQAIVAGCSTNTDMVWQTLEAAMKAPEDAVISDEALAKLPYSAIYAQVGDEPQALSILGYVKGNERQWFTKTESVTTQFGRLTRTAGLTFNLANMKFNGPDPLSLPFAQLEGAMATGVVDFMPGYRFGYAFESVFHLKEKTSVMVGSHAKLLWLAEERFRIPQLEYEVINHYWMDDKGLIWKSEQAPIPELPVFRITMLKPYSGDVQ